LVEIVELTGIVIPMTEADNLSKKEKKQLKKQEKIKAREQEERDLRLRKWLTYGLIALGLLLIGMYIFNRQIPIAAEEKEKPLDLVLENDWVKGNRNASIVVVEYSDFQCPACAAYADMLSQLEPELATQAAIVYRHYPLKQIHAQAELAAYAAEAAGKQGKFFEMHDMLFENQETWAENREAQKMFEGFASELGLNLDQFKVDMKSKVIKGLVKADYASGLRARITGTPTFFVNGERIENPTSTQAFRDLILSLQNSSASAELETSL
jgi:protein-disulfide isomerase